MDRWLASLQKAAPVTPQQTKPTSDPLVTALLDTDEEIIAPGKMSKVYDDGAADIADPVAQFFEKSTKDKLGIPEFAAPHADGTELEKVGNQVWKHTWQHGVIVKSELNGKVITDESDKPFYVADHLAKLIGLGEDTMHDDAGLAA